MQILHKEINKQINMKQLTIFTPTFNRAYCLRNLYESLLQQDKDSFIWLVVDDGSTDNTKELINGFIRENRIEIKYYYQDNAGKMAAHNKGAKICETDLFMCLDSDDTLSSNAVSTLCAFWESVRHKEDIAGIVAPRKMINENGNEVVAGTSIPDVEYSTLSGLYKLGYRGETALAFKTDVLRQFPFKIFKGEKFISEGSAYMQIDKFYKLAILDVPMMVCLYRNDGYTCNAIRHQVNSPKGMAYTHTVIIENSNTAFLTRIKSVVNYIAFSLIAGYSISKIIKECSFKVSACLLFPIGWLQKQRLLNKSK